MLSLKNISFSLLQNVHLELQRGDFCVVIGSNGSGKSTLIRTILGENITESGTINIDGMDLTRKDRSHLIAAVLQDVYRGTIGEMTLLENILLAELRTKKARLALYRQHEKHINEIQMLGLGLEKYLHEPLRKLSGGQRQMLATVMAVHSNPQLLLLDEHTSALDPKMQNFLMDYTARAIKQNNITSLMVTHKLEDAIRFGNRLIMLHQGKIVFDVANEVKAALNHADIHALFHQYYSGGE